jgi:DNA-binding LacI/PurR family transcriptional regulator
VSLTTVAQPALELATKATTAAIALATAEADGSELPDEVARNTILSPKLVVRGTTGPPRSAP